MTKFSDIRVPGNHRLLLFDQKNGYHGGLGFFINNRVLHFFRSFHQISDRVVYMDFFVPSKFDHQPPCKLRIVNCYSPTNPRTISNPEATDQFYRELQLAVDVPARFELWILGDFSAKLGKRSDLPNMSAPPRRCWVGNAASSVCAVGQRTLPAEVQSEPHLPSDVVLGQLVTERIGLENGIVLSFSS